MKIKTDFITNSSSTNFYFMFKGDHIDLYQRLLEHKNKFNLSYDTFEEVSFEINTWDVIREIDKAIRIRETDLWLLKEVDDINSTIKHFEEKRRLIESLIKNHEDSGASIHANFYKTDLQHINQSIQRFKEAKEKGLSSCLMISFGDNHGDVIGDPVGTTMDYSGRDMSINCPGFVVFTEQNR